MINEDLEKLLNRYIDGTLDFTAYRQQRLQLIREFIEDTKPDVTVPKMSSTAATVNKTSSQQGSELRIPVIKRQEPLSKAKRLQLGFIIVLVGIAIATWMLASKNPQNTSMHVANTTPASSMSNPEFIEAFLARAVWDSKSLSDVLQSWQELPREHQLQARQSPMFAQLQRDFKTKWLATEKLMAVGDKNAERQQQLLNSFAMQLSLELN